MNAAPPPFLRTTPVLPRPWLLGLLLLPIAALIFARAGLPLGPICAFRAVTGHPCAFCGGTHALQALASGNFILAFSINPLVAAGCVVSIPILIGEIFGQSAPRRFWLRLPLSIQILAALGAVLLNWLFILHHAPPPPR